jgi:hypothetical protein
MELTDLEILILLAKIEGVDYFVSEGVVSAQNELGMCREYDPTAEELMIGYRVHCKPSINYSWSCRASNFVDTTGNGYITNKSLKRAIRLAIIEVYK